jgi:molecular chaperone DnaK (HSP70)
MVAEAEKFAEDVSIPSLLPNILHSPVYDNQDELQRKRIESLNSLSAFVYGVKNQLGDQEGLGGKISDEDKKTLLSTVKETTDWIDENGSSASVEDLEEKLAGASYMHISDVC